MAIAITATTYDPAIWEADGYALGLTWSYGYIPGGPWRDSSRPDAEAAHAAWMRGFRRALTERGITRG